jgi:hypothetical protein
MTSGTGATVLALQNDGNLVLYGPGGAVWSSLFGYANTVGVGHALGLNGSLPSPNGQFRAVLQPDGNFAVHGPAGVNWSSGTAGEGGNFLVLQSDGNLVLYGPPGSPDWSSGTSGKGATMLAMQNDGNLVLYGPHGAVWSSLFG